MTVRRFAELLDRLTLTPARNGKLALLKDYFESTPDPDRGFALAALTSDLDLPAVKSGVVRALILERMDEELFRYSYDFVGDLAETVSLAWPQATTEISSDLPLGETVLKLQKTSRVDAPAVLSEILDCLEPPGRYAVLKLITGGLRVGVSARLAKQSLADFGQVDVTEIEEIWHGLKPPYTDLFGWLSGKAEKPESQISLPFRPVMLANPIDLQQLEPLKPEDFLAEWKWDGIRIQLSADGEQARLYSRSGDDISKTFPDIIQAAHFKGTIDGELLVGRPPDKLGTFSDLQQRLNRKTVSAKMLDTYPAFVRCYDLLFDGAADLRGEPLSVRKSRLQAVLAQLPVDRFDWSEPLHVSTWPDADQLRNEPPIPEIEGLMLKRRDSTYVAGRPKGPWFKWKRDPHIIDAVLMYAQRGHGKRSGYYSDYTFGVWTGDQGAPELVPVGKAYFGFTDEELRAIDRFVRENTVERYGPVRSVRAEQDFGLVLEVAFEGLNRSSRHKSGVAMRFPRISRLRWDKLPAEADRLESLQALLPATSLR